MAYADTAGYVSSFDLKRILPDEITSGERGFARGPVRALMAALLFDGIQSYIGYALLPEGRRHTSRYKEAFNWVHNKENDYIFSFCNVCEALGIDSEFLRLGLLNVCNSKADLKRSRRNF
ncbi:MAG: hypothetical protein J5J00_05280 [Deltaproteobacteria bacterium]|nr:hypothetical protein [Deltaproteobacteria bacterium]